MPVTEMPPTGKPPTGKPPTGREPGVNDQIPTQASQGIVPSPLKGMPPHVLSAAMVGLAAAEQRGIPTSISRYGGFRTGKMQRDLYAHRDINPNPVAAPGESQHEHGLAMDVSSGGGLKEQRGLATVLEPHGWQWAGEIDPVHFDYVGPGPEGAGDAPMGLAALIRQKEGQQPAQQPPSPRPIPQPAPRPAPTTAGRGGLAALIQQKEAGLRPSPRPQPAGRVPQSLGLQIGGHQVPLSQYQPQRQAGMELRVPPSTGEALPAGFGAGSTPGERAVAVGLLAPQKIDDVAHAAANRLAHHLHRKGVGALADPQTWREVSDEATRATTDFRHHTPLRAVQELTGVQPGQHGTKAAVTGVADAALDFFFAPSNTIYGPALEHTAGPFLGALAKRAKPLVERGAAAVAERAPRLAEAGERAGMALRIGEKGRAIREAERVLRETRNQARHETSTLAQQMKHWTISERTKSPAFDAAEHAFQQQHGRSRIQELATLYTHDPGLSLRRAKEVGIDPATVKQFGGQIEAQGQRALDALHHYGKIAGPTTGGAHFRPGSLERKRFIVGFADRMFARPLESEEEAQARAASMVPHPQGRPEPERQPEGAGRAPRWQQVPQQPTPTPAAPAPPAPVERTPWQARAEARARTAVVEPVAAPAPPVRQARGGKALPPEAKETAFTTRPFEEQAPTVTMRPKAGVKTPVVEGGPPVSTEARQAANDALVKANVARKRLRELAEDASEATRKIAQANVIAAERRANTLAQQLGRELPFPPEKSPVPPKGVVKGVKPAKVAAEGAGAPTRFRAGEQSVSGQWAVHDVGELSTSHSDQLGENPGYPKELQPRDRTRVASREQIADLERKLDPELMGESPLAQHGAPIIGPDRVVESGNARTIALRRAYAAGGEGANRYRQWLVENAERFGLDPKKVAAMREPILVRTRTTEMAPEERVAFTQAANARETAAMGAAEQARADVSHLSSSLMARFDPGTEGNLNSASNRQFVKDFIGLLPNSEHATMRTADGALSQEGMRRIQNAVFAYAYGESRALSRLAEATDEPTKNITSGLMRAAGHISELRARIASGTALLVDISPDIAAAADKLAVLRDQGTSVADYLAQQQMFGEDLSPFQRRVLVHLNAFRRSGAKVAALLADYTDLALKAGDPSTGSLFSDISPPTKEELWEAAVRRVQEIDKNEPSLFTETPNSAASAKGGGGAARKAAARPAPESGARANAKPPRGFHKGSISLFASTAEQAGAPKPVANTMGVSHEVGSEEGYRAIDEVSRQHALEAVRATGLVKELAEGEKPKSGWVKLPEAYGDLAGKQAPAPVARLLEKIHGEGMPRGATDTLAKQGLKQYRRLIRNARLAILHPLANPVGLATSTGGRLLQMQVGMERGLSQALQGKAVGERLLRGGAAPAESVARLAPSMERAGKQLGGWWRKGIDSPRMQELDRVFPGWRTPLEEISEAKAANLAGAGQVKNVLGRRTYVPPDAWKQFGESGAVTHGMLDQWAKLSLFDALRQRGLDPERAAKIVKSHLFDYNDQPAVLEEANRLGLWVFNAVPTKQAGLALRTLMERPDLLARYPKLRQAFFAAQPGSQEEYEGLPSWQKGAFVLPIGKTKEGQARFVNVGRWIPFTGFFEMLAGEKEGVGEEPRTLMDKLLSFPLWGPAAGAALMGRDVRTGRELTPEGAPPGESLKNKLKAMAEPAKPTTVRAYERLNRAYRGETTSPSPYGEPQTPGEAWAQTLGFPIYRGERTEAQKSVLQDRMEKRGEAVADFADDLAEHYSSKQNPYTGRFSGATVADLGKLGRLGKQAGKALGSIYTAASSFDRQNRLTEEAREKARQYYLHAMAITDRIQELAAEYQKTH